MIFGKYFFKKKIRRLINESRFRKHWYCSLDDAGNILVLFCNENKGEVEPYLEKLRSMKKRVYCVISFSGTASRTSDPSVVYVHTEKESDKYGIPNDEVSENVNKIPADILIDLSRGKCHVLKVLMLQHPSAFKVGERFSEEPVYDFSLIMTEGGGTGKLFEYLLFYLQSIRSK